MKLSALVLAFGFAFSGSVFATAGVWDTAAPWSTTTQYAEWNTFESTALSTGDTTPEIALSAGTTASLKETTGGAFLVGGNVYSFAVATQFTATLSGTAGGLYDVYLRIGTVGNTASQASAFLNGQAASQVVVQKTESQGDFGGFGTSYEQELYWKWTGVTGSNLYTFNFGASSSSMSLDQLALATVSVPTVTPVPEPETYGMMALGLGLVGVIARRRTSTSNT